MFGVLAMLLLPAAAYTHLVAREIIPDVLRCVELGAVLQDAFARCRIGFDFPRAPRWWPGAQAQTQPLLDGEMQDIA